jgi:hypothetical protein
VGGAAAPAAAAVAAAGALAEVAELRWPWQQRLQCQLRWRGLVTLDLGSNALGDNGAIALAGALAPRAQLLVASGPSPPAPPAPQLAGGGAALEWLSLTGNDIGNAGALALLRAFAAHPALVYLSLQHNHMTDAEPVVAALAAAGEGRYGEVKILVRNNRLGQRARAALYTMALSGSLPGLDVQREGLQ